MNDEQKLAIYAAEHPADDEELITPEWIKATFDDGEREFYQLMYLHKNAADGWGCRTANDDWFFSLQQAKSEMGGWFLGFADQGEWPAIIYTRGQLRRLLRALET